MGLLYLLVVVLLVISVQRLLHAKRTPIVITRPGEVSVRGWRASSSVAFRDVRQIDLARSPEIGVDEFCVILKANGAEPLSVSSRYDGFNAFELRMLELWPVIRPEWSRVRGLSPDFSERVIAWRRS